MPTKSVKLSANQIEALYKRLQPHAKKESQPQYTLWQIRTDSINVCAYQSGKVVISGQDIDWLVEDLEALATQSALFKTTKQPTKKMTSISFQDNQVTNLAHTFPQAGSDEVGNGDYLGPFVVASVIIENEDIAKQLIAMKITDSKAMTDQMIIKVAPKLMELVPYSVQVLSPSHNNKIYDPKNHHLNYIKAMMHNQAYLNLGQKGYALPQLKIVDQFCSPKRYFELLYDISQIVRPIHFETKAESKYISVACASVIARYHFLQYWEKMEEKYDLKFSKGGGAQATKCAQEFVDRYGYNRLYEIAKLHFVNTQRLKHDQDK